LTETIETIERLKKELGEQKVAVEKVLEKQKLEKGALVAKENEQQALLAETKGKEANYRSMISNARGELQKVAAQQQAAIARLTNNGRNTSGAAGSFEFRNLTPNQPCGAGGYPYCGAQDSYADPWALFNRECVSYAAWAASERFGKHVESFGGAGHAYQWPSTVLRMGADVNNTPSVGAVAITPQQPYTPLGHAMVVEEVYGDGWVRVSQYNFAGTGMYSTMDLKVSSAVYVHFK
jgi:surface antigen